MTSNHHKRESTFGDVPFIDGGGLDDFHGFEPHETAEINKLKEKIVEYEQLISELKNSNDKLRIENTAMKNRLIETERQNNINKFNININNNFNNNNNQIDIQTSQHATRDSLAIIGKAKKKKINLFQPNFSLKPLRSSPGHSANNSLLNELNDANMYNIIHETNEINDNQISNNANNNINNGLQTPTHANEWSTAAHLDYDKIDEYVYDDNNNGNNNINNNNNQSLMDQIMNENNDKMPDVERRLTDSENGKHNYANKIDEEYDKKIEYNENNINNNDINEDNNDKIKMYPNDHILSKENMARDSLQRQTNDKMEFEYEKLKDKYFDLSKSFDELIESKNILVVDLSKEIDRLRSIIKKLFKSKINGK